MKLDLIVKNYTIQLETDETHLHVMVHQNRDLLLWESIHFEAAPELVALTHQGAWNLNEVLDLVDQIEIELAADDEDIIATQ